MVAIHIKSFVLIIFVSISLKTSLAQSYSKTGSSFQIQLEEYDVEKKIEILTQKASELRSQDINEAILYYKFALELAENHNLLKSALFVAYDLADIFKLNNSYHYALKYYIKHGEIADALNNNRGVGVSHYYRGEMYHRQNNLEKAEYHYLKACDYFKNNYIDIRCCYNSLGLLYYNSDLNKALKYYNKANQLEVKHNLPSTKKTYLNNTACIYIQKGDLKLAKVVLDSALSISQDDKGSLSYLFDSYGEYYQKKKLFPQAEKSYLESINLHQKLSNIEEVHKVSLRLSTLYEDMNHYKQALYFYKQHKAIQDSINKTNNHNLFQKQEFEQNLRQLETSKNNEFINQKRRDLFYRILSISIFIVLLFILTIFLFKKKMEVKRIQLSKENKSLKESLLLEKIENKNKELTSKAILLSERNDLIKNVSEKLNLCKPKLKRSNVEIIQEVINDLNSNVNEKQWEDFQQNFNSLHPTFYKNLLHDFQTLSPKELKLCSFLKLNMTSKEIAQINHMTTNSVEVSRSRLRKKLDLSNSNMSLFVFLSKY